MSPLKYVLCALALGIVALALTVRFEDQQTATIRIGSVPAGRVLIDGIHVGESNQTFVVDAGEHRVEVMEGHFHGYETRLTASAGQQVELDVVLRGLEPGDPIVIAKLAESMDIAISPFASPTVMRGGRNKRNVAVLLWPARDVRKDGLTTFAIEADEAYAGDASLEFRRGSKVLYRAPFVPESITTVRSLPAAVLEHAKVGRTITWGLYFDDRRHPITAKVRVVNRPRADRQVERMRTSRHLQRQPLITRQLMAAAVLENNRLYTEALVANLKIATEHPHSIQPYRGIVTTLRRMDGESSELFAFVSPRVGGKGGHSGLSRPAGTSRAGEGLEIAAWSPAIRSARAPVLSDHSSSSASAQRVGPHGQGVSPADRGEVAQTPSTSGPDATTDGTDSASVQPGQIAFLREQSSQADEASRVVGEAAQAAGAAAEEAEADAVRLEQAAVDAEDASQASREIVEQAEEPTVEQMEAMAAAGRAAEEAREAASAARESVDMARADAARLAEEATQAANEADLKRTALEQATPSSENGESSTGTPSTGTPGNGTTGVPTPDQPLGDTPEDPTAIDEAAATAEAARLQFEAAEQAVVTADEAMEAAQIERDAAEAAQAEDPSEGAATRVGDAATSLDAAVAAASEARTALASLGEAVSGTAGEPQSPKASKGK